MDLLLLGAPEKWVRDVLHQISSVSSACSTLFSGEMERPGSRIFFMPRPSLLSSEQETFPIADYPEELAFDLEFFRSDLEARLDVPMNRLLYVDNDGDMVPIDSQEEFLEAWKVFRAYSRKGMILLIDNEDSYIDNGNTVITAVRPSSDLAAKMYGRKQENRAAMEQKAKVSSMPECAKEAADTALENNANKGQDAGDAYKPEYAGSKICNIGTNEVTEKMNLLKLEDNLNHCNEAQGSADNMPPTWFTTYMEKLKKDIIKEVSDKVTENIMELLYTNTVESTVLKELNQPRVQSCQYSFQSKRHNPYCHKGYPEEKRQHRKKKKVLEDGKGTDLSSERDDRLFSRNVKTVKERERKLQKKLDYKLERLEGKIRMILEKKKRYRHVADIFNTLDKSNIKQQDDVAKEQNKTQEEFVPMTYAPLGKVQSAQDMPKEQVEKDIPRQENEIRMNCSITGHQMLDKTHFKDMFCSAFDIDNVSICSDISNISYEKHNFEMVQMPLDYTFTNLTRDETNTGEKKLQNDSGSLASDNEKLNFEICKDVNDRSNTESPSFELLSETPSPPLSIYIDEDHFSKTENNAANASNPNLSSDESNLKNNAPLVVDINGKVYNKYIHDEADKCVNSDLEKRPYGTYSFVAETLPVQGKETCSSSKSIHVDRQSENNMNDLNTDVKSSHSSYPSKTENIRVNREMPHTQDTCHLQTDMGDFTQSFHSHTTSTTDDDACTSNDAYSSSTSYKYTQQVKVNCTKGKDFKESKSQQMTNEPDKKGCKENSSKSSKLHENMSNYFCANHFESRGDSRKPPSKGDSDMGNTDTALDTAYVTARLRHYFDRARIPARYCRMPRTALLRR